MSDFTLPAGTIVKYGTVSTQLYPMLRNGIQPAAASAIANGIYVGELMAYFSACTAFCDATGELHRDNEAVMDVFVKALQDAHGQKPAMPELEDIAVQAGMPVVLDIELGEACTVWANENFIEGTSKHEAAVVEESVLSSKAEKSWGNWRCGVIVREGGIPANWIKKFHFPRLLDYRDAGSRSPRTLEQTTDCALMVGGLMQSWHKDFPADLLSAFRKQYGRTNFSQSSSFDDTALERFFNLNAMLDPATRLLNQMTIWQDIDALAKKQGIPLA
ncbi:hypothetical protein ACO0LO_28160 [Undibacterium sp. TJN25]|uniref:hypothetical protein n=1 Tax=Undibacterium sp. TJN25 TaxID=3413056 RepID=UPI003BF0358A